MDSATDDARRQGVDAEAKPIHRWLKSAAISATSVAVVAAIGRAYPPALGVAQHSSADDIVLTGSFFPTATPMGPAFGDQRRLTWGTFACLFESRRVGKKDGPNFIPARFSLEPGDRQVRRLKAHLLSRTAIALDIERNKETGEIPPALDEVVQRVKALGLASLAYTSHNHKPVDDSRYRIVIPISEEIAHELPAPEVVADRLQLLGVLDRSKIGASSLFYLPSSPPGLLDQHRTIIVPGLPIDAGWIVEGAGALLAARNDADCIASKAQSDAAARRAAKIAAGCNPDDLLIERLRSRLDLDAVLRAHGYDKAGKKYRHPNSTSGSYGADIKILGDIERVFSHNGSDPLHASNLPDWCDKVTALDVVDVVTILDFGGDRTRALGELAKRFGLSKPAERKELARLLFRLVRQQAPQEVIETAAFKEGERLGLSRDDVCQVAVWVSGQANTPRAA